MNNKYGVWHSSYQMLLHPKIYWKYKDLPQ
jgi:hypothetical protein